ncbi:hypothetical protein BJX66DRAFT_296315 [Aspergillus keveii]|uniref:Uncharacterized protein n=1 Tax=Aspergillus keveii TaxID=714993 RepID=A0ABR4GG75_9EURO
MWHSIIDWAASCVAQGSFNAAHLGLSTSWTVEYTSGSPSHSTTPVMRSVIPGGNNNFPIGYASTRYSDLHRPRSVDATEHALQFRHRITLNGPHPVRFINITSGAAAILLVTAIIGLATYVLREPISPNLGARSPEYIILTSPLRK